MAYRDDLDAARTRRETLARELADVRARLADHRDLIERERELAAAVSEADRHVDHARARTSLPLLREIRVASPCHERWEDMSGDERTRHCGKCDKDVHDLSAMSAADAEALLAARGASLCVRLYRRFDGTVITSDCPEGARLRRKRRIIAATAAITATLLGATGAAIHFDTQDCERGKQQLMGAIALPEPQVTAGTPPPSFGQTVVPEELGQVPTVDVTIGK